MKINKRDFAAVFLDFSIVVLVLVSAFILFLGPPNRSGVQGLGYLRYYTADSNLLLGVAALVSLMFDALVLFKKKEATPRFAKSFLLCASAGTTLVVTAIFYMGEGRLILPGETLQYAGMFMHLITPLVALVRVVGFEEEKNPPKLYDSLFSALPMFIYGVIYIVHLQQTNGYGIADLDWYGSGRASLEHRVATFIILFFVCEVEAMLCWILQKLFSYRFG